MNKNFIKLSGWVFYKIYEDIFGNKIVLLSIIYVEIVYNIDVFDIGLFIWRENKMG